MFKIKIKSSVVDLIPYNFMLISFVKTFNLTMSNEVNKNNEYWN